ncbi:MAG TPA: hypothetical protein VFC19_05075 [Candidatus Limnocylindrales bacterium]|nr:hypothetical protein [Candidatus Limnocylindrales bacterium]
MRRHLFRTAALCGLAGLVAAVVPATAASAAPRVDLGSYDSYIACDVDAQRNNQLGYPGTFSCARARDGRVHQYYTPARAT